MALNKELQVQIDELNEKLVEVQKEKVKIDKEAEPKAK